MRPRGTHGEIRAALLRASEELVHEVDGQLRGPTLQELAQKACVGLQAARRTVDNMRRSGALTVAAERRVAYRNRPVAEYAPARAKPPKEEDQFVDVASVFAVWAQG